MRRWRSLIAWIRNSGNEAGARYECLHRSGEGGRRYYHFSSTAAYVYLPFVVLAELRSGFAVGRRGAENDRVLLHFLMKVNVGILYPDAETIVQYAALFKQLRTDGRMIPTNDLWIAAIVVQHKLTLCTRDSHFDHLPQIDRPS